MVAFSLDTRARLAATEPRGGVDRVPAHYSKLGVARRAAVRERYAELQDGLCYHCQAPLDGEPSADIRLFRIDWRRFPGGEEGFLRYPVHLHHDHDTDLTIGAVHALCNAVLFQYHGE